MNSLGSEIIKIDSEQSVVEKISYKKLAVVSSPMLVHLVPLKFSFQLNIKLKEKITNEAQTQAHS